MEPHERHIGRNISRVRELLGVKQEALAFSVGMSQQSVSILERSARVDDEKITLVATALHVSPNVIKNFDEKKVLDYFENLGKETAAEFSLRPGTLFERLLETLELNRRLQAEKQLLYERLLQTEQEKCRYLEKIFVSRNPGMDI